MTTITQTITSLPAAPDIDTMTQDEFSAAAAAMVLAQKAEVTELNTWATQANAMAAGLNAIATGAALAIPLTFSTTTTDSDPGNGILRLNQATQNTATVIRTDLIGNDGSTWTDVIALFDDSTSTVKGFITLVDTDDATKWLVFSVASLATPSGYVNITVTCVASSAANPFANNASLALQFTRTGDKGDTGATGTGIVEQAVGFTATGGTTPKTLTVDDDLTTAQAARRNAANTFTAAQNFARATVASHATTADIWAAAGNQIDWTGTATTTAFPNAPQGGAERVLICAGACSFTAGANMLIDGVASAATMTCAAGDSVIVRAVSTTQFKLSRVKYDGTAQVAASAGLTLGTPVATTSGTAIDFTGIPSGTKQVVISFSGVSTNGASNFLIQIGDAGGIEATDYTADAIRIEAATTNYDSSTAGFLVINSHAAYLRSGRIVLSLLNATTFTWVASIVSNQHGSAVGTTAGVKALSAELDRVRLTTANGTDTFDAGAINIAYI